MDKLHTVFHVSRDTNSFSHSDLVYKIAYEVLVRAITAFCGGTWK